MKAKDWKYKEYALIEFRHCHPLVIMFHADEPITVDSIKSFLIKTKGFDESNDSITLISKPTKQILT
jgi:hypothetical protein